MDPKIMDLIQTIVSLLPVAALIWKAARMAEQIDVLKKEVHRIEVEQDDEKHATDSSITMLTNMLTDIKITVTRIETKLEERGGTK